MKRGVPPTALNARTGELTPPGVTAWARSNSAAEVVGGTGLTAPLCPPRRPDHEPPPAPTGVRSATPAALPARNPLRPRSLSCVDGGNTGYRFTHPGHVSGSGGGRMAAPKRLKTWQKATALI